MANKITSDSAKGISTILIALAVIILGFLIVGKVFGGITGLFEKLGLADSKEEKADSAAIRNKVTKEAAKGVNGSAWSPYYYKQFAAAKIFTMQSAIDLAKQMWDSVGYVWDTPSEGAAAIRQCKYKTQVSFLAYVFNQKYSIDLLVWLENKYDTSEQKRILTEMLSYVDSLPLGG